MYRHAPGCRIPYYRAWVASLLVGSTVGYLSQPAAAQIIPDETLGEESSVVNTVAPQVELIEGGAQRGEHLFHSFEEFNIDEGWTANFANPEGIFNILSRVTGENPSQLFGTLGVLGEADLFFINPNGVVFGPNARLEIPGSFTASTADSLILPGGGEFSATNPGVPPLLTVDVEVPIGVRFDDELAAALGSEAVLEVGQDLTLSGGEVVSEGLLYAPEGHVAVEGVAGNVQVQDLAAQSAVLSASGNLVLEESRLTAGNLSLLAGDTVRVRDSEANPFFAVAGGDLLVQGNEQVDIFALNHPNSEFFSVGNMFLISTGTVLGDAHYSAGGDFRIENLDGELAGLKSPNDPVIRASGDVEFDSYEGASLHILAGGSVRISGSVIITGTDGENGLVESFTLSDADATPISINGRDEPTLDIRAGTLAFEDNSSISGSTDGFMPNQPTVAEAQNGSIETSDIIIGSIFNNIFIPDPDNGSVVANTGRIFLTNQYEPNSDPDGIISITGQTSEDDAISAFGNPITIVSRGNINIVNPIRSDAGDEGPPSGNEPDLRDMGNNDGGNITLLSAGSTNISDVISRSDDGDGGQITIQASGDIVTGTIESTFQDQNAPGPQANGGEISVVSLGGTITTNGSVNSRTKFGGRAGNILLDAGGGTPGDEENEPSGVIVTGNINSEVITGEFGDAGNITVTSQTGIVNIIGSTVSATTGNSSIDLPFFPEPIEPDSGNVDIEAAGQVTTGSIRTSSNGGNSGFINVLSNNSEIQTNSLSSETEGGTAERIVLNAAEQVVVNGSITTSSDDGNSGLINIRSDNSGIQTGSLLSESSDGVADDITLSATGSAGFITVNSFISSSTGSADSADNSGSVDLDATGQIEILGGRFEEVIDNESDIELRFNSISTSSNAGNSGSISITSTQGGITIENGMDSRSTQGRAGRILLSAGNVGVTRAEDSILIDDFTRDGNIAFSEIQNIEVGDINSESGGGGEDAGGIIIRTETGEILTRNLIAKNESAPEDISTDGGSIELDAFGTIETGDNIESFTISGESGSVEAFSYRGGIRVGPFGLGSIDTFSEEESANSVSITAYENIEVGDIDSTANGEGNPIEFNRGDITIASSNGWVSAGNLTSSTEFADESIDSGNVQVTALGQVTINSIRTASKNGRSGNINISSETGTVSTGSLVSQTTSGEAGSISAISQGNIETSGEVSSRSIAGGLSRNITFESIGGQIDISNSDLTSEATSGEAGGIFLTAEGIVRTFNVSSNSQDISGLIRISTNGGLIVENADITSITSNMGSRGIQINAPTVTLDNATISATTTDGEAGTITINAIPNEASLPAASVNLTNDSNIIAEAEGVDPQSRAGNIIINARNLTLQSDPGEEFSEISTRNRNSQIPDAERGMFGNVVLENLDSLTISNGSISTETQTGIAGDVTVNPEEVSAPASEINLNNGSILAQAEDSDNTVANVDSRAGNVAINARNVTLSNQSEISTSNESSIVPDEQQDNFGNVTFSNIDSLNVTNSLISTETDTGTAGSVTISGAQSVNLTGTVSGELLDVEPDFVLDPSKPESGFLDPEQRENFSRAGIVAQATGEGGQAGSVNIQTNMLTLDDRAQVAASSSTEDGVGNIIISANTIRLDNEARIIARNGAPGTDPSNTPSDPPPSDGNAIDFIEPFEIGDLPEEFLDEDEITRGNIILSINGQEPIVRMFNESQINALATGNANGGNIAIYTLDDDGFVIANPAENSDIIASAQEGDGGRVFFGQEATDARTFVLGLRVRPALTIFSDIFVSSAEGASGLVAFTDPITEGFLEVDDELPLPNAPALDEGCQVGFSGRQAEFFDFGLGGSPPRTDELIGGGSILSTWIPFDLADSESAPLTTEIDLHNTTFAGLAFRRLPLIGNCHTEHRHEHRE